MSYRDKSTENPVGDDPAFPKFNLRLPQVLAALFVLAVVLSIYKYVEQTYIAPRQPIQWREFSVAAYRKAEAARQTVLVMVSSDDHPDAENRMLEVTRDARIQQLVHRLRAEALQLSYAENDETAGMEKVRWIQENFRDGPADGLLVRSAILDGSRFFPVDSLTVEAIVEYLDEIYRA